jgi:hypothetical protein
MGLDTTLELVRLAAKPPLGTLQIPVSAWLALHFILCD